MKAVSHSNHKYVFISDVTIRRIRADLAKRNVSVYLDEELLRRIDLVARVRSLGDGAGRSELIEEILSDWVSKNPARLKDAEEKANEAAATKMSELASSYGFAVSAELLRKMLKDRKRTDSTG